MLLAYRVALGQFLNACTVVGEKPPKRTKRHSRCNDQRARRRLYMKLVPRRALIRYLLIYCALRHSLRYLVNESALP